MKKSTASVPAPKVATRRAARKAAAAPRAAYHHGDLPDALGRAVLELVAEKGVHNVSMSDAARRAGVSVAAPYRHYKSLDELLVAVALKVFVRFREAQRRSIEGVDDPEAQLLAFVGYFFVFAEEDPAGFTLLFNSGMTLTHRDLDPVSREAFEDALAITTRLAPHADDQLRADFVLSVFALVYGNSKLMVEHYSPVTAQREFPRVATEGVKMLIGYLRSQSPKGRREGRPLSKQPMDATDH